MLDSANETVSALKGEVADLNAELDEARRCTEESELQFRRMHDQGEQERASLRCDWQQLIKRCLENTWLFAGILLMTFAFNREQTMGADIISCSCGVAKQQLCQKDPAMMIVTAANHPITGTRRC